MRTSLLAKTGTAREIEVKCQLGVSRLYFQTSLSYEKLFVDGVMVGHGFGSGSVLPRLEFFLLGGHGILEARLNFFHRISWLRIIRNGLVIYEEPGTRPRKAGAGPLTAVGLRWIQLNEERIAEHGLAYNYRETPNTHNLLITLISPTRFGEIQIMEGARRFRWRVHLFDTNLDLGSKEGDLSSHTDVIRAFEAFFATCSPITSPSLHMVLP